MNGCKHPPRHWTGREETMLLQMRRAGRSWDEIALALGRRPKTVEWYAYVRMGLLGRAAFKKLKESLEADASNGPRPTAEDFAAAHVYGTENRGWGRFLDCETVEGGQ